MWSRIGWASVVGLEVLTGLLQGREPVVFDGDRMIRLALEEDIGPGDVTTEALIDEDHTARAVVVAKEPLVLAGMSVARRVFVMLDRAIDFTAAFSDGDAVETGDVIFEVRGRLRSLLTGERTALNFLQRLSGIATNTRHFIAAIQGKSVRVTDTRKTTPGWRRLEKYAVRVGGGKNHRFGLYDGILIKENHIRACGGITRAVELARRARGHLMGIEVEVTTLEEVREALANEVDTIMLDNMNPTEINRSVTLVDGRVPVEVSGGVTLNSLAELADTGVDIISIGALTHSARAVDMSMQVLM